jgi:antitoxin CptB
MVSAPQPSAESAKSAEAAEAADLGRLRWRCRRGMRELDILLSRYVNERFRAATAAEQAAFRRLLEVPDGELHAYCLEYQLPPPDLAALVARITAAGP